MEAALETYLINKRLAEDAGFYVDEGKLTSAGRLNIFTGNKKFCIACCDTAVAIRVIQRYRNLKNAGHV